MEALSIGQLFILVFFNQTYSNKHVVCERPTVTPTAMFYSHADDDGSGTLECLTGHVIKEFLHPRVSSRVVWRAVTSPDAAPSTCEWTTVGRKICQLNNITRNEAGEDEIVLGNSCSLLSKSIN